MSKVPAVPVQPRFIRANQAPGYLGMCRDVFNKTVRPYVREFPIGLRGIGFDRNELDQWADAYIAAYSVHKRANTESPPPPIDNQQSKRKKRGPITTGLNESASAHRQQTSDEFYRVLESIRGKPAAKNDRKCMPAKK
jgi:predicted DNA-binding transcriptional regulator AlpA